MSYPSVNLSLPDWVDAFLAARPAVFPEVEDRMELAIDLARENVRHGDGPFGAAIFDASTHRLLAPGVNLVVASGCSVAHAEMLAIMIAQRAAGSHDLSDGGRTACELVTSSEPCAQCFGAIPWAGLTGLVCGAPAHAAETIGFDEGPKPGNWVEELERRGIAVTLGVLEDKANAVLREFKAQGHAIY
jgi:tRNA(Arg) A34 adenosine deaminase TadA